VSAIELVDRVPAERRDVVADQLEVQYAIQVELPACTSGIKTLVLDMMLASTAAVRPDFLLRRLSAAYATSL
jgi:hypothetical protein